MSAVRTIRRTVYFTTLAHFSNMDSELWASSPGDGMRRPAEITPS
jgi:hypothetical protein